MIFLIGRFGPVRDEESLLEELHQFDAFAFGFFQQAQKFWKTFDGYTKWVLPSAKVGRIPLPV